MMAEPMTWGEAVGAALGGAAATSAVARLLKVHEQKPWAIAEADRNAAEDFHVELISRVATQRLEYSDGVEERALESVSELFRLARQICDCNSGCASFEIAVWTIMNGAVRPFTARWHPRSQARLLRALDASDEFRAELLEIQHSLRDLHALLLLMVGRDGYRPTSDLDTRTAGVLEEMARSVTWAPVEIASADVPEREMVLRRRATYDVEAARSWASGIALSGGGIRSATFALGVLTALCRRGLLPQFDYLSTVSGGGYAGAFLVQLLGGPESLDGLGLKAEERPFAREMGRESKLLRGVRQRARFLSGSFAERAVLLIRQTVGVFMSLALIIFATSVLALADAGLRAIIPAGAGPVLAITGPLIAVFLTLWFGVAEGSTVESVRRRAFGLGLLFLAPPALYMLSVIQDVSIWGGYLFTDSVGLVLGQTGALLAPVLALLGAVLATAGRVRPLVLLIVTILIALLAEAGLASLFAALGVKLSLATFAIASFVVFLLWRCGNPNRTSLHGYYKAKLSSAFLVSADGEPAVPIRLSEFRPDLAPFPIFNCAINVPGSESPALRGRLSDIFAFTPVGAGAGALGGPKLTREWETNNPELDLAAIMALSGAAASPQMGLRTSRVASFWLALLNARLGLWLKKPGTNSGISLAYLWKELLASATEDDNLVHLSDGGHIENLGVYELIRRRCRYIVSVDGENDPRMTFHALTNLQRLVYIDFGVTIEADLDDLRLDSEGFSRTHFRFCRIRYPGGDRIPAETGYLVYLKLSLTGNEGEFIRRFKLDEPAFPHHSTADQFFSEPQFEAYRALGEHVGDKLFLKAIVGDRTSDQTIDMEEWMASMGRSFL